MIREATLNDIPRLVDLGMSFYADSIYRDKLNITRRSLAILFLRLIRSSSGAIITQINSEKKIIGMIGVVCTAHPHSGDVVLLELFWFVATGYRGGGLELLRAAEMWGRANGASKMIVAAPAGESGLERIYERMNYEALERQFIKDL